MWDNADMATKSDAEFEKDMELLDSMIADNDQRAKQANTLGLIALAIVAPCLALPLVLWKLVTGQKRRNRNGF